MPNGNDRLFAFINHRRIPRPLRAIFLRLLRLWHRLEIILARNFGLATHEDRVFFLLVPTVGFMAGFTGFLVTLLIGAVQRLLWGAPRDIVNAANTAPAWVSIAAPVVGGVVVGAIIWWSRQSVAGHGISGIVETVNFRNGEIRARPVILRLAAAIATVGSGGSLGREGPTIGTGSMLASQVGSRLGISPQRLKILVGCGAAGGMAAIYNAPVGAALFATEVILASFALEVFGPLVVSSVIATLIGRTLIGREPIYMVSGYGLKTAWEIVAYIGLGVLGAFMSIAFTKGIRFWEIFFERLLLPRYLKPILGLGLVGVLGLYLPEVFGNGFETITRAVHEGIDLRFLVILPLAKLAAVGVTIGSGCPGGLFTPSLFVGALTGGIYGFAMNQLFPAITTSYGAYAVVGMAAIAAGTSHAPISAIMILFEMTGNYDLILPIMIASIISSLVSKRLYPYSIYLDPLHRRGLVLPRKPAEMALSDLSVKSLLREDRELLRPTDTFKVVVEKFLSTRRQRLFVVSPEGRLQGEISLHEIKHMLDEPVLPGVVAHDLMQDVLITANLNDPVSRATELFSHSDYERIPVVDPAGRFVGLLAKRDILSFYAREILNRPALMTTFVSEEPAKEELSRVELPVDYAVRLVRTPSWLAGRSLDEAALPLKYGVRIIEIRRASSSGSELVIPDASSIIQPDDDLIVLGSGRAIDEFTRVRVVPAAEPPPRAPTAPPEAPVRR